MIEQQSLLKNVTPLRSRQERACCSRCGQRLPRVFRHKLNQGLVSVLWKLYHAGKPTRLTDLQLSNSEFANAQKLGYFGLAQSVDGRWALTEKGLLFLGNRIEIEKFVHTKAGKVVEREETIKVQDVDAGWWQKIDYAREARRA